MMLGLPSSLAGLRGLAGVLYSVSDNVPGENNACGASFLGYVFDPMCWGNSFSDWQTAYNGQSLGTTLFGTANTAATGLDVCGQATGVNCTTWILGIAGVAAAILLYGAMK